MSESVNLNKAIYHLKNIIDNIRCAVCDKPNGTRVRYFCGHTSCKNCADIAIDCSQCLTPSQHSNDTPVIDLPFTERAENAVKLLNAFQNEFHIDVFNRERISEQLKVEKDLFPQCIQAPAKYCNKRKSYKSNKENRLSQLPGEDIDDISSIDNHKMENSNSNVESWLNKYVRKPFADLNTNNEQSRILFTSKNNHQNINDVENVTVQKLSRKRPNKKKRLSVINKQSLIKTRLQSVKKKEIHKKAKLGDSSNIESDISKYFKISNNSKNSDKNESGIVIDDEAIIYIEDSQSDEIDKDTNAWLAVQEAEKNKQSNNEDSAFIITSESINQLTQIDFLHEKDIELKLTTKVPFILKSCLADRCSDCIEFYEQEVKAKNEEPARDMSITIENNSFVAIINVTNVKSNEKKSNVKQSVEVQTDISELMLKKEDINRTICNNTEELIACKSQNIFDDDKNYANKLNETEDKNITSKLKNKSENVIIEESDTDEELEASVSMEVVADVHRSCEENILGDVENLAQHSKRPRRGARGYTPSSTNSSEKENFNPNRKKRTQASKKKPIKK